MYILAISNMAVPTSDFVIHDAELNLLDVWRFEHIFIH